MSKRLYRSGCIAALTSLTAWLGAGTRLPEADHALARRGYTLGHTPQKLLEVEALRLGPVRQ